MRFRIERVRYDIDGPPAPGAEWVTGTTDVVYHTREGEEYTKTRPDNHWEIEVNTLEELMDIVDENGIIVYEDSIIIYDDYIE